MLKALGVGILLLFAVMFFISRMPQDRPNGSFSDAAVTLAAYSAIKDGMSYSQVVGIIGRSGTEASSNNIAGMKTVVYSWKNPNGSNMNAMFQNDALVQKAQFGLK